MTYEINRRTRALFTAIALATFTAVVPINAGAVTIDFTGDAAAAETIMISYPGGTVTLTAKGIGAPNNSVTDSTLFTPTFTGKVNPEPLGLAVSDIPVNNPTNDNSVMDGGDPDELLKMTFDTGVRLISAKFNMADVGDDLRLFIDTIEVDLVASFSLSGDPELIPLATASGSCDLPMEMCTINFAGVNLVDKAGGSPMSGRGTMFEWMAPDGSDDFLIASITVPEPTTVALLGLGLAGIGYKRRRKPVS